MRGAAAARVPVCRSGNPGRWHRRPAGLGDRGLDAGCPQPARGPAYLRLRTDGHRQFWERTGPGPGSGDRSGGSAAYLSAEHADLLARRTAGHELAGNKNINAPPKARAELESGQVDSRLLITLAALTHKFSVQILGFSDAGPGAGSSGPLRLLTVTTSTTSYLHQLLAFLDAQRPPLLAMISQRRHGRMTIVQIHFTAPSPTGLLPSGA